MKALDPDLAFAALDALVNPMTRPRSRRAAAGAPAAELARQKVSSSLVGLVEQQDEGRR